MLIKIFASFMFLASANTHQSVREMHKKHIMDGCMKMSKAVLDVRKRICECVVENFDRKVTDGEMAVLADHYKPSKRPNVGKGIGGVLDTFDHEVAEKCIADPKWRVEVE